MGLPSSVYVHAELEALPLFSSMRSSTGLALHLGPCSYLAFSLSRTWQVKDFDASVIYRRYEIVILLLFPSCLAHCPHLSRVYALHHPTRQSRHSDIHELGPRLLVRCSTHGSLQVMSIHSCILLHLRRRRLDSRLSTCYGSRR